MTTQTAPSPVELKVCFENAPKIAKARGATYFVIEDTKQPGYGYVSPKGDYSDRYLVKGRFDRFGTRLPDPQALNVNVVTDQERVVADLRQAANPTMSQETQERLAQAKRDAEARAAKQAEMAARDAERDGLRERFLHDGNALVSLIQDLVDETTDLMSIDLGLKLEDVRDALKSAKEALMDEIESVTEDREAE